ncbi:MAG TPA: DUF2173 family protein [Thermomicrobiales bacterium]
MRQGMGPIGSIAADLTRRQALRGLSGAGLVVAATAMAPRGVGAAQTLTEDEAEALADRLVGRFNAGDVEAFDSLIAADAPIHWFWPVPGVGPSHLAVVVGLVRTAVPDATLSVNRILVSGDWVTALATLRGTHTGRVLGLPPSGRAFSIDVIVVGRVEGGMVAELWIQYDLPNLIVQIGGLADVAQQLLASLTQGSDGGTPQVAETPVSLDDLLAVEGVVFAVSFGPDGSLIDYRSEIDIPLEEIEQAAAAGPGLSALLAVAAERYNDISVLEWSPPAWAVYSGGERWTAVLAGNIAVIAETATVDFNALYAALVGPR